MNASLISDLILCGIIIFGHVVVIYAMSRDPGDYDE
tara:strand:- start:58 stop:165 length:108 start_codon:yes stop_codon:yes gene_type:complete